MINNQIHLIYKILKLKGVGPVLTNKVLSVCSFENFDIQSNELRNFLNDQQIGQLEKEDTELESQISNLKKNNGEFISILNSNYPKILSSALKNSTPPILSYFGNLQLLQKPSVGFCGSRKASQKGLEIAKDCVERLVNEGFVLISGYADGVDQQVHLTALESGGSTIIIMPQGLLNFKIRTTLRTKWDWNRVLVISEFLPNAVWLASRAMQRNRTIIGLSRAMVLIEAGETGGSIDAGIKTLDMKRNLFIPFYGDEPESAIGNKKLLALGGIPLLKDKHTGKPNLNKLIEKVNYFKIHNNSSIVQLSLL